MANTYLQLHFHDGGSPAAAMATLNDLWASQTPSGARLRFLSPFVPTVPGSDKYTDELW